MNSRIILLIGILAPCLSFGIVEYKPGDNLYIWAESGLKLREAPALDSKVITKISFGEKVMSMDWKMNDNATLVKDNVILISGTSVQVEFKGRWAKVKYESYEGYIFDAYLSRFQPMPKDDYPWSLREYFMEECGSINYLEEWNRNLDSGGDKIVLHNGIFITNYSSVGGYSFQINIPEFSVEEAFLILRHLDKHATEIIQRKNGEIRIVQEMGGYTIESLKDIVIISGAWSC